MILSMTGYGRAESQFRGRTMICEVRSLNSKAMDLSVRLSPVFRSRELDLRALVTRRVERGKVDLSVFIQDEQSHSAASFSPINWAAVDYYVRDYRAHYEEELPAEIMAAILRFPDVLKPQEDASDLTAEEWQTVQSTLDQALDAFLAFRAQEGEALRMMFAEKLNDISDLLAQVEPLEKGRIARIKERLEQSLAQLSADTQAQIDRNRLEQEMIYYLEKLDITEEKVRLTNHIRYFRETMEGEGNGVGKKLGFIAQEMGREINTLGSKSNQSEMQILVVRMKDVLEQIKEQVLNVL